MVDESMISCSHVPVVSIVIPTYNNAEFIDAALQSVINQTFTDWEAIIINNYSEDNTVELVKKYTDPRIKLIDFRNHGIIAASRNQGILKAQGKWIAFLDSDDIWYPGKLEKCLNYLNETDEEAICHGERWVTDEGYSRDIKYGPEERASYTSLLYDGNCISTSAVIVDRCALNNVDNFSESPEYVNAEDYDLWMRLVKAGTKFIFLDELLGEFRIHPAGNTQAVLKSTNATICVIDSHFRSISEKNLKFLLRYRKSIATALYGGGRLMQKQNQRLGAFKLFAKSIIRFPFKLNLYIAIFLNALPVKMRSWIDR